MTRSRGLNTWWILSPLLAIVLVSALLGLLSPAQDGALANGAARAVVKNRVVGPYELQVGILPGSPKVGNLHLSILVKDAESKAVITTGRVTVTARGPEGATNVGPLEAAHTLESPQFYDANITLDMIGRWVLDLQVESSLGEESLQVPLGGHRSRWHQPGPGGCGGNSPPDPCGLDMGPDEYTETATKTESLKEKKE